MQRFQVSAHAWKYLVSALVLGVALLFAAEVGAGIERMRAESNGTLGLALADRLSASSDRLGTHWLRVGSIPAASPLARAGARPQDLIRFDRPLDRWRQPRAGEAIGLTLSGADDARHLVLRAQPAPISEGERIDYWGRLAISVPALLFAALVATRQPSGRAYRALALTFLGLGTNFFYTFSYAAPGLLPSLSKLLQLTLYPLIFFWYVGFAMAYSPPSATRLRRWLLRCAPPFRAAMLLVSAYTLWFGLGHEAPLLWPCVQLAGAGGFMLAALGLVEGWRASTGEARQRHRWLLLALACGALPPMLTTVGALDLALAGERLTVLVFFAGQLTMFSLLAYAVLRHRVFDFDFAVSRALVFSVVSVLLVCAFGLVEWLVAPLLHDASGHGPRVHSRLTVDAGLAVLVYFLFSHLHERIERGIERIFFRGWHEKAHRLRAFVDASGQAASSEDLLAALAKALDAFTGGAGVAVYLARRDGHFTLALAIPGQAAPDQAAPHLGADDPLAVVLRSHLAPVRSGAELAHARAELALPMCHRGALHGLVLLGAKARGNSYRPDEVAVLDFAVRQVGLGLHARRVLALERAVTELAERSARQREAVRELAGRRALRAGVLAAPAAPAPASLPAAAAAPVQMAALP